MKLRSGGVVDSDDLGRGYLIGHLLGRGNERVDEESEPITGDHQNGTTKPSSASWGRRGISVSADDHYTPSKSTQDENRDAKHNNTPNSYEDAG